MTPETQGNAAAGAARCPACGAAVRADAPWCTQCFLDLRPTPEPPPEPEPEPAPPPPAPRLPTATTTYPDPLTGPLPGTPAEPAAADPTEPAAAGPTWPCTTCGTANALSDNACTACGSGFLAAIREGEGPLLVLPGVGDLSRYSRGQRFAIAGGVVLVFLLLTFVVGLLLS